MSVVPLDELYHDELFKQPIDWSLDYAAVRAGTLWPQFARGHDWAYRKPAPPADWALRRYWPTRAATRGRW